MVVAFTFLWAQIQSLQNRPRKSLSKLFEAPEILKPLAEGGFLLVLQAQTSNATSQSQAYQNLRTIAQELDKINDKFVRILAFSPQPSENPSKATFSHSPRFVSLPEPAPALAIANSTSSQDQLILIDSDGWVRLSLPANHPQIVSQVLSSIGALVREKKTVPAPATSALP